MAPVSHLLLTRLAYPKETGQIPRLRRTDVETPSRPARAHSPHDSCAYPPTLPSPYSPYPPVPHGERAQCRHLKSNKGGGTAPRDAAAFSNPTVDSPTFSFRWDGAIQFIEPAGAFPQRSSYQPTGGTTTERSLVCASNRSRYRKRRARTLLYPHNPSDTPPVSVAVTLRLF